MDDCHGPAIATLPPPETAGKQHIVAIVGPPNSGKSTLFNRLTGLRQKVANFPGVTVEHRMEPERNWAISAKFSWWICRASTAWSRAPRTSG